MGMSVPNADGGNTGISSCVWSVYVRMPIKIERKIVVILFAASWQRFGDVLAHDLRHCDSSVDAL